MKSSLLAVFPFLLVTAAQAGELHLSGKVSLDDGILHGDYTFGDEALAYLNHAAHVVDGPIPNSKIQVGGSYNYESRFAPSLVVRDVSDKHRNIVSAYATVTMTYTQTIKLTSTDPSLQGTAIALTFSSLGNQGSIGSVKGSHASLIVGESYQLTWGFTEESSGTALPVFAGYSFLCGSVFNKPGMFNPTLEPAAWIDPTQVTYDQYLSLGIKSEVGITLLNYEPVPEPSTLAALTIGAITIFRRRTKK